MIRKMLRHTVLSVLVIGIFAGSYALTLGNGLAFARNDTTKHHHTQEEG